MNIVVKNKYKGKNIAATKLTYVKLQHNKFDVAANMLYSKHRNLC